MDHELLFAELLHPHVLADLFQERRGQILEKLLVVEQLNGNHVIIITSLALSSAYQESMARQFFPSNLPVSSGKWLAQALLALGALLWLSQNAMADGRPLVGVADVMGGKATLISPDAKAPQPLKAGAQIREGDTLETAADGYVYINTRDQGFISLRPKSRLTVDLYRFDPKDPAATQIRWTLKQGVVRVVSGRGMESAKDRFRLNTPIAAIGVRGTEFSVFAGANVTRASISTGAIAVSPFTADCTAATLGPCGGASVLDLAEGMRQLIQVGAGDSRPRLINTLELGPDRIAPPRADEVPGKRAAAMDSQPAAQVASAPTNPSLNSGTSTQAAGPSADAGGASASGSAGSNATAVISNRAETVFASQVGGIKPAPLVHWGRWQALAGLPAGDMQKLFAPGKQLAFILGPYGLARDTTPTLNMPQTGVFSFALQDYEAFVYNGQTKLYSAASIQNPSLVIDFGTNRFTTSLNVIGDGLNIDVRGQGGITPEGLIYSDIVGSQATIRGALAGTNAEQAGYVFQRHQHGLNNAAVGATRWMR